MGKIIKSNQSTKSKNLIKCEMRRGAVVSASGP